VIEGVRPRRSIFARLMAVMVVMAVGVPAAVAVTFFFGLQPSLDRTLGGHLDAVAELLASRDPDLDAARAAAARYDLGIRYRGPRGDWATEEAVPVEVGEAGEAPALPSGAARCGQDCRAVRRPDGGTYVFVSHLRARAQRVHDWILGGLLVLIAALIVLGHEVLRRAVWPLRSLYRGVAALSAGDLAVEVPRQREDELGALADAFNRMVGRVREMIRARDQLLLDVSHELRSPLTRMRVALALQPEGEARTRLERNVAEMEAMVTELLERERLRDGRGLALDRHDVVEVVRDAVLAFTDRPPGVTMDEAPATATATLDPDQVRSVMNNLLENALRYALPDSAPIRVAVRAAGDRVEVTVTDDGPGFPPEDLPHLFEPFFRVDRSRSRRTGGYGLGLSLCRRIMEAHGGTIEARNRPGRGAELVLGFRS
jgi:signal transduction histidine kinase